MAWWPTRAFNSEALHTWLGSRLAGEPMKSDY